MSIGSVLYNFLIMPLQLIFEVIYYYAYRFLNNPGLSIIVLSLAINFLVLPLYRRADKIQEEERLTELKLKPVVDHIKKTFKGDERTMMLQTYYRQQHYSPLYALRSAVSLFLQIPFFIAAYQFLSHLELLQGVGFGPIVDLGAPDGLLVIGNITINLLPIVMTVVNLISTIIFSKEQPLKMKIQLYALAAFFLVFLYDSPAGLVFYWTLNNVFSLVKTIFYKLKNPGKVLKIIALITGMAFFILAWQQYRQFNSVKRLMLLGVLGLILCLPAIITLVKKKFNGKNKKQKKPEGLAEKDIQPDKTLFYSGAVFLSLLAGLLIPSALIASSPQEFVNVSEFVHPLWYMLSALMLASGLFVFWGGVFYSLASPKAKKYFEKGIWVISALAIVNYLFFGKNLGTLSADLVFHNGFFIDNAQHLLNGAVVIVIGVVCVFLMRKWQSGIKKILLVGILTMCCMSGYNMVGICRSVAKVDLTAASETNKNGLISLSKNGQNVIVLMMDRALGEDVPFIFNEKPALKEKFSGFTYYRNVVSFGPYTNFATPALYGGYEYTPVELNSRADESLEEKHNEALKVMPVLFSNAGYNVTVCDPSYAGYEWIPDLTIYDDYPEIKAYNTNGNFSGDTANQKNRFRNFFCYSLMKMVPTCLQSVVYNGGNYNIPGTKSLLNTKFMDAYNVLCHLPQITSVTETSENTFLMMSNNTTHEETLLQEPDYVPSLVVDNAAYDAAHQDRFSVGENHITVSNENQMAHYHVNMASFLKLGDWFDHLKALGVYDNTRIIIVSDHGSPVNQIDELITADFDLEYFYPLLMVKDFNSSGFNTADTFMTNADVPVLATNGLIDHPENPFTGKSIDNTEKTAHPQYLIASLELDVEKNNGKTFLPADWYTVKDSIFDKNNWQLFKRNAVLKKNNY